MPDVVAPQLAMLADAPPSGPGWVHEVKFDGYRFLAHVSGVDVRLVTRNGNDWTDKFPTIARALRGVAARTAILDGEAVILNEHGVSDFQALQAYFKNPRAAEPKYYAFDLVYCDGYDLRAAPLIERKALLRRVIDSDLLGGVIQYSDHVEGNAEEVMRQACAMHLEGVISKRADAPYVARRAPDWLKIKCGNRQEFVIIGYTDPQGSRTGFGSIVIGYHDDAGRLVYAGRVGTGFDDELLRTLHTRLTKLGVDAPPTDVPPPPRERREVHWVEPRLVCEVRFTEWTRDGVLRHPTFVALRSDKPASQIVREKAIHMSRSASNGNGRLNGSKSHLSNGNGRSFAKPRSVRSSNGEVPIFAGVHLSNPGRVLYPEQDITKLEVAEYYNAIADRVLPYVADRPLAIVRCPLGQGTKCFFQKHLKDGTPDTIHGVDVGLKEGPHLYIKDLAGLIQLVQMGVLEIHVWGCKIDDIERPDQLTFDLDPDPEVGWPRVCDAAREMRDLLAGIGLNSFVKTTGGKGLHVVVPLKPSVDWDEAKAFTKLIAEQMSADQPDKYLANMSKAKRKGKIFIDYLRNGRGATAICAYSTRARPGAPVSMPLRWDELAKVKAGNAFTVENAAARVRSQRQDPWHDFDRKRVDLARVIERAASS